MQFLKNKSFVVDIWAVGVMFAEILLADGTKFFSSEGMLVSFYIYASFFLEFHQTIC